MAKAKEPEYGIYLDSNVLIELIERPATDPLSMIIQSVLHDGSAAVGRFDLVTSTITIAEVIFAKRERDGKAIDPAVEAKLKALWHPSSPIRLVEVHELIVRDAADLVRDHLKDGWSRTGGIDAIHLITAKRENVREFMSHPPEQAMKKWAAVLGFAVNAPHYEVPVEVPSKADLAKAATAAAEKDQQELFANREVKLEPAKPHVEPIAQTEMKNEPNTNPTIERVQEIRSNGAPSADDSKADAGTAGEQGDNANPEKT